MKAICGARARWEWLATRFILQLTSAPCTRLRDATPPSTKELINLMPVLATVEMQFLTWLSLIANQKYCNLVTARPVGNVMAVPLAKEHLLIALLRSLSKKIGDGQSALTLWNKAIVTSPIAEGYAEPL